MMLIKIFLGIIIIPKIIVIIFVKVLGVIIIVNVKIIIFNEFLSDDFSDKYSAIRQSGKHAAQYGWRV